MKKEKKIKIAALIGRGGRLRAIYRCCRKNPLVDLILVLSHKKRSPGIQLAKKRGIEAFYFRLSDWKKKGCSRSEYNLALAQILKERKIDLVLMAGWDLILSNEFFRNFQGKVMNIHPSLMPAFPGPWERTAQEILDSGVKYTGCTIHFVVDEKVDNGPIIFQDIIKIDPKETIKTLEKKLHPKEERLICEAINLFAERKLKIIGRKVKVIVEKKT